MNNVAIAFLTTIPKNETIQFAEKIEAVGFDVFIIYDNEENVYLDEKLIRITDKECINTGYINSNISASSTHIHKNPIAWDKFIYFFCEIKTEYDFIWVFEDDCFIPSVSTIEKLNYNYNKYDLVTPNNFKNLNGKLVDWHWKSIFDKINPPYAFSMVCAMGLSRNTLNCVKSYKNDNNSLIYIEVMFNTLALQNNLNTIDPKELKSIVWLGDWGLNEFLLLPNNVFHPRKDIENFNNLRKEIVKAKLNGVVPKNNLPHFLK